MSHKEPWKHKPMPPHGDPRRYRRGDCRCDACCQAYADVRRVARARRLGKAPAEAAAPVRAHITGLISRDMPLPAIAVISGLTRNRVYTIMYGRRNQPPARRIEAEDAKALLAVQYDPIYCAGGVKALGSVRRIQSLGWMSQDYEEIATGARIGFATVSHIAAGYTTVVTYETHERILAYYLANCDRVGHAPHAAEIAFRTPGSAPPKAWAYGNMDDPLTQPRQSLELAPDSRWMDAEPVRAHVVELCRRGMSLPAVAIRVPVSPDRLRQGLYGEHAAEVSLPRLIRAELGRQILAVGFDPLARGKRSAMDVIASRRRVQGLMWMGWTLEALAAETGLHAVYLGRISSDSSGLRVVAYRVHVLLKKVCDRLGNTVGGSRVVKRYARDNGFAPLMAWDEEAIDDPNALPNWGASDDPTADAVRMIRYLHRMGMTFEEVCDRLGRSARSVAQLASRAGIVFEGHGREGAKLALRLALRRLYDAGATVEQAAVDLGRSRDSIKNLATRMGIAFPE